MHKRPKIEINLDVYEKSILKGDRVMLGRAITLIESRHPAHKVLARTLMARLMPHTGHSLRIGITGVPGVGKSTFIEALGKQIVAAGHRLAVLAIDPSSSRSRGSIMGDKTRMESLSIDPRAFIRPSPAQNSLGGVARKTRETMLLCEAAGFDIIFIETVGVGQSETLVHGMVDFFLLLMLAGAGDELQGIKRGIMEMAHALVINKADGENQQAAQVARAEYESALHLFPAAPSNWSPRVKTCSALKNQGIQDVFDMFLEYEKTTKQNGFFYQNRQQQNLTWMYETIHIALEESFYQHPAVKQMLPILSEKVAKGELPPLEAAQALLEAGK
ncbi:MAG: methylmalonyl Co-A mutase-associated GTPase MeaB [Microscillaceae bacterium]|nr:methylmalonyl Co-A mutase-associated GTPase MeaB [Microscillaceae bacterium]